MTFLERWLALEHLFAHALLLLLLNGVHWHPDSPSLFLVKLAYITLLAAWIIGERRLAQYWCPLVVLWFKYAWLRVAFWVVYDLYFSSTKNTNKIAVTDLSLAFLFNLLVQLLTHCRGLPVWAYQGLLVVKLCSFALFHVLLTVLLVRPLLALSWPEAVIFVWVDEAFERRLVYQA